MGGLRLSILGGGLNLIDSSALQNAEYIIGYMQMKLNTIQMEVCYDFEETFRLNIF